ncbi:carbon-nitrogen hydrolase family protein [Stackebrandtia albiflava]|uniref:carbon-nitrogen hydrolase family protein n=1 Tax=Stackebrandtia albiflava TaxID=406432 RepID=UPI0011BF71B1|nr:carbon-nitrogen hydrolase family protein [Stackebrandtia albiflava]
MTHPDDPSAFLRVAAVQAASIPGDIIANANTAAGLIDRADHAGADVVVFPELFLPGYHPPTWESRPALCDLEVDFHGQVGDRRLDPLRDMAQRHRLCVLVGASVRQGPRRHIATLLVNRFGVVRDVYHKQHLVAVEKASFTAGDRGTTVVVNGWRLGVGVCYDATFPEHARAAATDGCHAYVTGGAFNVGGEHRRDLYHAARALDNTFYVVFAGGVGGLAPWTLSGGSAVFDPEGRVLDRAPGKANGLAVADLEAQRLAEVRRAHTMLSDLRTDLSVRDTVEVEG